MSEEWKAGGVLRVSGGVDKGGVLETGPALKFNFMAKKKQETRFAHKLRWEAGKSILLFFPRLSFSPLLKL